MSQAVEIQSPESLDQTIDRLCREQGRKAYWVATRLGVSYGTLRAIRDGKRPLKGDEASVLADVFGVPVSTFLPPEDSNEPPTD